MLRTVAARQTHNQDRAGFCEAGAARSRSYCGLRIEQRRPTPGSLRAAKNRGVSRATASGRLAGGPWGFILLAGIGLLLTSGCGPTWYLDPSFGERLAKEQNKPLLFYFKAWDSTQHRNMKEKVFKSSAVQSEMMDTVNIELEFAWAGPYRTKYKVQQPQVCVMSDSTGRMVSSALYVNPVPSEETFLSWLRRSKAEARAGPPQGPPPPAPKKEPAEKNPASPGKNR
jgi:hypothetical protein